MTRSTTRSTTERHAQGANAGVGPARRKDTRGASWRWPALGVLLALVAGAAVLYVLTGRGGGGDGGSGIATLRTADFHALAFSPTDANVAYFGHHDGVMRSDDGGHTWRKLVERRNFDAMGLAVNPTNPRQIYLAGHEIFQLSTDSGASWQPIAHNLPDADIHGFAMSPDDPSRLYAFVVGHGLFGSADGGKQWEKLSDRFKTEVISLVASTGGILFAGVMDGGVLKSGDGGKAWTPSSAGLGAPSVIALAVAPPNGTTVYAGTDAGLYRSDDAGGSWRKLPFPGKVAVALAVSPPNPNVVLAIEFVRKGEGRVYRSEDGGASWGERRS